MNNKSCFCGALFAQVLVATSASSDSCLRQLSTPLFPTTQPMVRRFEVAPAIRVITQYCGTRVPQNNQQPTSLQHAITSSLHHITTPTIVISSFSTAPFLSEILRTSSPVQHGSIPRTSVPTTEHLRNTSTNTFANSGLKCSTCVVRHPEEGGEQREQHTLSTPEEIVDPTEHHQAGIQCNPLHRRPDSGFSLRRELLVL